MKKASAENIKGSLPSLVKNLSDYLKSLFSLEGKKEIIDNASGTLGFLIQLVGKPVIDKYFEKVKESRLEEFGFDTYIAAAFRQAYITLQRMRAQLPKDIPLREALLGQEKAFIEKIGKLEKKFAITVFQPRYHPGIQMVRETIVNAMHELELPDQAQVNFRKIFNENIEVSIAEVFGEYYKLHLENVMSFMFQESETRLLMEIIDNSRIGFSDEEDLKYEQAYGFWTPIEARHSNNDDLDAAWDENQEHYGLKLVEDLIEDYFSVDPENHLDKALFLIADFGKGKSVFLKQYAAKLAKSYLETGEGDFPVYFNLRSYSSYYTDSPLGVLEDFLLNDYAIRINDDYFKKKRYVFLIDSLDESCDLSKNEIDRVLNSVKRIQNIDKTKFRTNRIIITSRPFDDGLFNQIYANRPYEIVHDKIRSGHYLAIYGFTKLQFNNWICSSLKSFASTAQPDEKTNFANTVLRQLKANGQADVYSMLNSSGELSTGELRRPIFAYMIYQLLLNNIAITSVGKVGIYLSFLNLLTKDAKYMNDRSYRIKLQDQFEARSMLHQIAALWIFEKGRGKQAILKKADICRLIGGFSSIENDEEVFEEYRKKNLNDIQFLSHSYFGENDNKLHFQHQSFAEILLAEYYLKVFICFALEPAATMEQIVPMFTIGNPTSQCIGFFAELLRLLKASVGTSLTPEVAEVRKLLVPLLASVALPSNNRRLNSQRLLHKWYEPANINATTREIPHSLLSNWFIDQEMIDRIVTLCEQVIRNQEVYVLSKATEISPLIRNEVTHLHNRAYSVSLGVEKQLSLLTGSSLYNDGNNFFIRRFSNKIVLELLSLRFHFNTYNSFDGIRLAGGGDPDLPNDELLVENLHFDNFHFSNIDFRNVSFLHCNFFECGFHHSFMVNVRFQNCNLVGNRFVDVNLSGSINLATTFIWPFGFLPTVLANAYYAKLARADNPGSFSRTFRDPQYYSVMSFSNEESLFYFLDEARFYLGYCFENTLLSVEDALEGFVFSDAGLKTVFEEQLQQIKNRSDVFSEGNGLSYNG